MASDSASDAKPSRKRPAMIVPHAPPDGAVVTSWRRLVPAWLISSGVHGCLFAVLLGTQCLGIKFLQGQDTAPTQPAVVEAEVADEAKPDDLENDEIGVDPTVPYGMDVDRKEEIVVPGPVKPDDSIGVPGGTDTNRTDVPPPPGFGPNGNGGGTLTGPPGTAPRDGTPGGFIGAQFIPGGLQGRSGATREKLLREGGGNGASEAAVASGLKWLHLHQAPDGHWSLDHFAHHARRQLANGELVSEECNCTGRGMDNDVAGTAFGLLPMLGAGETHRGGVQKGNIYTKDIERGLKYLILKQHTDGDFGGGMYGHGLAAIAMCEAYGMTGDPLLKGPAQRALNFIVKAQGTTGGWDYMPRGPEHDTSVGGWQLMALKSGQMAGLDVPNRTLVGCTKWLDDVATPDGSGYGYRAPGATPTMTAVGLLCRQYLGWGPRNPALAKGVQELKQTPPRAMHNMGGEAWEFWNPKMRDWLISTQDRGQDTKHPHQKGSWSPKGDVHGLAGGRIMLTSMSVLTLEVYYRHLPLYRRDLGGMK
jgi:hypothetical protein